MRTIRDYSTQNKVLKNQPAADAYLSKGLILMQKDYSDLRQKYPAVISSEQLSKICHISKRKPHQKPAAPVDLAALRAYTQRLWRNEPDVLTV